MSNIDTHYMHHALNLARSGLGRTAPNPSVGCVLVKDGHVIAAARTADGGRPHAEAIAVQQAGDQARGTTAYVTLEPCAHEGETPSCARLLVEAGITRVVIATNDPDPRTAGQGVKILERGRVEIVQDVLQKEAQSVSAGFIRRVTQNRPFVTLKCATSLDGKIALESGESQWITGDLARRYGHLERATHDAIMVGVGTVIDDDPSLTVRLGGDDFRPVIILDTALRTPVSAKLLQEAQKRPVHIIHQAPERAEPFLQAGALLHELDPHDINAVLTLLAQEGLTRLLVEGGAKVITSFLEVGLYDRLLSFRAPAIIGGEGKNGVTSLDIQSMQDIYQLKRTQIRQLGEDILEIFEPCLQD